VTCEDQVCAPDDSFHGLMITHALGPNDHSWEPAPIGFATEGLIANVSTGAEALPPSRAATGSTSGYRSKAQAMCRGSECGFLRGTTGLNRFGPDRRCNPGLSTTAFGRPETISVTYLEIHRSRNNNYVDHSHIPCPRCKRCSQTPAGVWALGSALPPSRIRCHVSVACPR